MRFRRATSALVIQIAPFIRNYLYRDTQNNECNEPCHGQHGQRRHIAQPTCDYSNVLEYDVMRGEAASGYADSNDCAHR